MRFSWQLKLGLALISFSIAIYSIKFLVLKNPADTLNYVFNSLGFLPISAFLVTIILNELLTMRSRRERLEKLNMVIGTFFSEVGTTLLAGISDCDPGLDEIRKRLLVRDTWQDQEFDDLKAFLESYRYEVDISKINTRDLTAFLDEKRNFLLRLLENPVLLEHQMFTETLRTVFHLTEELERRKGAGELPDTDLSHINGDLVRVYRNISIQWVEYMKYLKKNYPYLFSLAMRTNPFDQEASVIVRK